MRPLYAIRVVAALLALLYLQSAWDFIVNHSIAFVAYAPTDALAGWTVANLGARLLAIAFGLAIALVLRDDRLLALMLAVRLTADLADLAISSTTQGVDAFVAWVLAALVVVEAAALAALIVQLNKKDQRP